MKVVGLSREGCKAILVLSLITLVLAELGHHSFAPKSDTIPFIALIVLCVLRLSWPERRESKSVHLTSRVSQRREIGSLRIGVSMGSLNRLLLIAASMAIISVGAFFLINNHYSIDPSRLRDLEGRVQRLEESQNSISMFGGREHIMSADHPVIDQYLDLRLATNGTNRFQLRGHYKIPDAARPVAAWVSEWTPRAEMLKFDEFHVVAHPDSGDIKLIAKPRSGETIDMIFDVGILMRDHSKIQIR